MYVKQNDSKLIRKVKKATLITIIVWIVVVSVSLFWTIKTSYDSVVFAAKYMAELSFDRDVTIRRWAARQGGLYVPETKETPSNPYLEVPDKNIQTPSGKKLTLMNPAYMTRQFHEMLNKESQLKGNITSLKVINPKNMPDEWEKEGLEAFDKGATEYSGLADIEGEPYFRFMKPLIAEKDCLKCHSKQGYVVGDVRGGVSQSVWLTPLYAASRHYIWISIFLHLGILMGGLGLLKFGERYIVRKVTEHLVLEQSVLDQQQQLVTYEALLKVYAERSPLIYGLLDPSYHILDVNLKFEEEFKYKRDEVIHKSALMFFPEEEQERVSTVMDELKQNSGGFQYSGYNMDKNGHRFFCEWYNTPVVDDDGNLIKIICMGINKTEQKHYEEELSRQVLLFETLINSTDDLIHLNNLNGNYVLSNIAFQQAVGKTEDEVKGSTPSELFEEDIADQQNTKSEKVVETKEAQIYQEVFQLPTGESVIFEMVKSPVLKKTNGDVAGVLSIGRDITRRVQLQEELRMISEENSKILSTITCGVVRLDHEGKIEYINDNASKLMKYEVDELIGKSHHQIVHTDIQGNGDHTFEQCPISNTFLSGQPTELTRDVFWDKMGNAIDVEYKSVPLLDEGHIVGAVLTYRDIRKNIADERRIINTLKEKEVLIQEIHHRVKNNMQVIYSLLSLQADQFENSEMSGAFVDSQNRILSMATVHQMLYQSENMTEINMKDYIESMVELICSNYGFMEVEYHIDAEDIYFDIDKAVPAGLMINEIISNSLKHTPDIHSLKISFKLWSTATDYVLNISDNGNGFPENFDVDSGTTLGCQLIKGLVDQLNGKYRIYNEGGACYEIKIRKSSTLNGEVS